MNRFLQRLMGRHMAPLFEFTPGDTVWKVQPTASGLLAGETRNTEHKSVSFFAINAQNGSPVFRDLHVGEPWWVALELVVDDIAVLHRFPKPDMPNALGATAIDCATGRVLWDNPGVKVICGSAEVGLVHGYDPDEGLAFIDLRTGQTLQTPDDLNSQRIEEFHQACAHQTRWQGWISASDLLPDMPGFEQTQQVIARAAIEQRGAAEVARCNGLTALSLHEPCKNSAQSMLDNRVNNLLLVHNTQGRVVYRDNIWTDAAAPGADSFFIWRGVLFYIRQGKTIVGLRMDNVGA